MKIWSLKCYFLGNRVLAPSVAWMMINGQCTLERFWRYRSWTMGWLTGNHTLQFRGQANLIFTRTVWPSARHISQKDVNILCYHTISSMFIPSGICVVIYLIQIELPHLEESSDNSDSFRACQIIVITLGMVVCWNYILRHK